MKLTGVNNQSFLTAKTWRALYEKHGNDFFATLIVGYLISFRIHR